MTAWENGRDAWTWDMDTATASQADDTGVPVVQVSNFGKGTQPLESHHPYGFYGRPNDPDGDGACLVLQAYEGDRGHGFPMGDVRLTRLVPALKRGGSMQAGARGTFQVIDGENGGVTLYCPYAFTGSTPAKAMLFGLDVSTAGSEQIQIVHGSGMSITMIAGSKYSVVIGGRSQANGGKGAFLEVNDDGISLSGGSKVIGSLEVGTTPLPLPPLPTFPVMLATPDVLAFFVALEAWMAAVVTAGAAPAPAKVFPPPPPIPPLLAATMLTAR